jgi:hypothetical protein
MSMFADRFLIGSPVIIWKQLPMILDIMHGFMVNIMGALLDRLGTIY